MKVLLKLKDKLALEAFLNDTIKRKIKNEGIAIIY